MRARVCYRVHKNKTELINVLYIHLIVNSNTNISLVVSDLCLQSSSSISYPYHHVVTILIVQTGEHTMTFQIIDNDETNDLHYLCLNLMC